MSCYVVEYMSCFVIGEKKHVMLYNMICVIVCGMFVMLDNVSCYTTEHVMLYIQRVLTCYLI